VPLPPALRRDIVAFYGTNPRPTQASNTDRKHLKRVERALAALKATPTGGTRSSVTRKTRE
jgi:hypothetical protein